LANTDEIAGQAARAYLAECLAGTNIILTAYGHAECADLSRRLQRYLPGRGQLQPGPAAALNGDAHGYAGDLIVARQDGNHLRAGEPGRTLATGDLPRVAAVGEHELTVSGHDGDPCCSRMRRPACCLPASVLPGPAFLALASGGNAGVVSSRRMAGAGCSVA